MIKNNILDNYFYMNNSELIENISKNTKIEKNKIKILLSELKYVLLDALKKGEEINIKGFGKFFTRQYNEKYYVSPISKKIRLSEPSIKPKFKFSAKIKF